MIKADASLKPDLVVYTHRHPDHFTMRLAREINELYPEAPILAPVVWQKMLEIPELVHEGDPIGILVEGEHAEYKFTTVAGNISVRYDVTEHSGKMFEGTPHYSVTVESDTTKIFFASDVKVADPTAMSIIEREKPEIGFFTFPWITLERGREAIEGSGIEHIVVYHIPFKQHDDRNYRDEVAKCKGLTKVSDERILLEPLQKEILVLSR